MKLHKDLEKLIAADIITPNTAEKIRTYYQENEADNSSRIFLIFGVVGAVLVGLGLILILAHNWDELPRSMKTALAFLPLLVGQTACGYTLLKRRESEAWRESSAAFLFLAVGASISLISQIYNISGNMSSFILTWALLGLPLVYVMRSSVASLFYWLGVTWYMCETNYWVYKSDEANYWYWLLILPVLPHYFFLCKNARNANYTVWHHWAIPFSVMIAIGVFIQDDGFSVELVALYLYLFAAYQASKDFSAFMGKGRFFNGWRIIGLIGTLFFAFILTFVDVWTVLQEDFFDNNTLNYTAVVLGAFLGFSTLFLLYRSRKKNSSVQPTELVFLLFSILLLAIGLPIFIPVFIMNIALLGISIYYVLQGLERNSLVVLNFGLLILTILVVGRFFDTDIGFTIKGTLSMLLGFGFFFLNYKMLQSHKKQIL